MNLFAQFRRFIYPREALVRTGTHELKERCSAYFIKYEEKIKILLLFNEGKKI